MAVLDVAVEEVWLLVVVVVALRVLVEVSVTVDRVEVVEDVLVSEIPQKYSEIREISERSELSSI